MSVTTFRLLLAALVLLTIGIVISDTLSRAQLPEPLKAYLDAEDNAEPKMNPTMMAVGFMALSVGALAIISTIGLFVLWRPARILYTLSFVVALPLYLLMGPTINTGLTEFLSELASFLGGVIWALIYFSPLRQHFDRPTQPLTA